MCFMNILFKINVATYKVAKDVVKAQHMFDDHAGGESEVAERAEVVSLLSRSNTNAFNKMLHAYKTMIREDGKGEDILDQKES